MTNIEKIDNWVTNCEDNQFISYSMLTEDARFLLDRIAKLERLAEAVTHRRKLDFARNGGVPVADAFVAEGEALAACEEETDD